MAVKDIKINQKMASTMDAIKEYVDHNGAICVMSPKTKEGWEALTSIVSYKYSVIQQGMNQIIMRRASYEHPWNKGIE